ncbi:hypothetical protein EJ02DRAFT_452247 [Clathrospora elynae]|uniref:Uncharacterized protein n=1 Tax=Clathrospora elynae TaxID=706981 RepID=A0A6A5SY67_9PLEO|nr:hypothetical protein EJ02DRAFT_452247 [Clathrospora elynae]
MACFTVHVGATIPAAQRSGRTPNTKMMPTSTHNNSTNMSPIDTAVEDFKLQEL